MHRALASPLALRDGTTTLCSERGANETALQALLKDIHSNTSRGPSASLLKTWESMHHAWHGREVPVWPLTPDKILAVASTMKMQGYRSFPNYMSKAKDHHVALSGYWSDSLSLTARKGTLDLFNVASGRQGSLNCSSVGEWRCPFHAATRQWELLESIAKPASLRTDFPFFPDRAGNPPSKEAVVCTFEYWHAQLGLPLRDADGRRLLGGHSARLGGAQLLAREGLLIVQIELMARWVSPMILHDAKSAPLTHITEDYEKLKSERELHKRLDELASNLDATR